MDRWDAEREDIHLSPYQADEEEDVAEFIRIIKTFQRHLPLRQEPNLEQHYEYLFSGSVGCVGILKNWLTRSLRFAIAEEARTLKLKHLKMGGLGANRLKKIKEEAEQGLRRFLSESNFFEQPYSRENRPKRAPVNYLSAKSKGRVGQRKPQRDIVGVNPDGS